MIDLSAYNGFATIDITDMGAFTRITVDGTDTIDLLGVGNATTVSVVGGDITYNLPIGSARQTGRTIGPAMGCRSPTEFA